MMRIHAFLWFLKAKASNRCAPTPDSVYAFFLPMLWHLKKQFFSHN